MRILIILLFAINASGQITGNYNRFTYYNDYLNDAHSDGTMAVTGSGSGAASMICGCAGLTGVGILNPGTGSTATGRTAHTTAASAFQMNNGAYTYETRLLQLDALSDATNRYQFLAGFFDTYNSVNQTDGAYFVYDEGGVSTSSAASANWQCVTASGGSRTFYTTSTAVSTGETRLRIETDPASAFVSFYINGTLVHTASATIPASVAQRTGAGYLLIKSIGASARSIYMDYQMIDCIYSATR